MPVPAFMKRLQNRLAAPSFPDEEQDRLSRTLHTLLWTLVLAALLAMIATFASGQYAKGWKYGAGGLVTLLLLLLLYARRLKLAISLTFPALLFIITFVLFGSGGIHDLSVLLFPVVIIIAGLLLGPRGFIATAVLSMLLASFIIIAELAGLIDAANLQPTSFFSLINVLTAFLITAVPVRLLAVGLFRSLARSRENERSLGQSNARLQQEISGHQATEKALRESEMRFRILAESAFEGLCISENDVILDANSSLALILGCPVKEVIGRKISDFLDPVTADIVFQQLKAAADAPYEHMIQRVDGSLIPVESRKRMIPFQGRTVQVWAFLDISERRRIEEEQRILEAEIRQNQKLESLGTLAGGIAHDFNNIISIIGGHTDILAEKLKEQPAALASVQTIHEAAERGSSMVRQILTFARKSEADFRALHIQEMVDELVKMLRVTFPRAIEIHSSFPPDLPPVWMDPSQMHQALLNLCINARDAMAGTGRLEIRTSLVNGDEIVSRFPAASGKRLVRIQVSDTGAGMDEKTRARIFEPFFSTKGRGRGTGLGLAVVYGVVSAHKGFIDVESRPGQGTTFSLFFPASERRSPVIAPCGGEAEDFAGGSETILVVEDEEDLRELLSTMLHDHGYGILVARDGLEALERYRRHKEDIDLVITDMDLPKINGAAVSRSILDANPQARIILISGFIEASLKEEILSSGVREFMAKPYTMPQMLQAVRQVLDRD